VAAVEAVQRHLKMVEEAVGAAMEEAYEY